MRIGLCLRMCHNEIFHVFIGKSGIVYLGEGNWLTDSVDIVQRGTGKRIRVRKARGLAHMSVAPLTPDRPPTELPPDRSGWEGHPNEDLLDLLIDAVPSPRRVLLFVDADTRHPAHHQAPREGAEIADTPHIRLRWER